MPQPLFELTLDQLTYEGDALGRLNGFTVFVPLAVPQDRLGLIWQRKYKGHGWAWPQKILQPSPYRVAPRCAHFGDPLINFPGCGSCQWQMVSYEYQLKAKKEIVEESLRRIGKLNVIVENCVGMKQPWAYRNKAQLPLQQDRWGHARIGFFERATHDVVDMQECPVSFPMFGPVIKDARRLLDKTQEGLLRFLCLRGSEKTQELLIIWVSHRPIPRWLSEQLLKIGPRETVGIIENVNVDKGNVIYGPRMNVLWGRPCYFERVKEKQFRVSAASFFQTNTSQLELVIGHLMEHLPQKLNTVVDAFCGVGVFSLFFADRAQRVIGIEEALSSCQDAQENQRLNKISNIEWLRAPVEDALEKVQNSDLIFVDPPRQGLAKEVILSILKHQPPSLIYLSCNPTTLARDLRLLVDGGYRLDRVVPFDFFPHTYHVETLAYISK